MKYKHKRGYRVCGSYVDLGWGKGAIRRPNIAGDGTFEVSEDAPKFVHDLLQSNGHVLVSVMAAKLKREPKPKPEPEPVYKGYPDRLVEIKGVGKKTAHAIGSRLKTPKAIIDYDASHKRGPGSIVPGTWLRIVDFVKATWDK